MERSAGTKKEASKEAGSETTTKRVTPTRVKGWLAYAANAYGAAPGTRKLDLSPPEALALKKRTEADGTIVTVLKPLHVYVRGTARCDEDGKVYVSVDSDHVAVQRQVEDLFLAGLLPFLPEAEGRTSYATYYGDNLVKLKDKHFGGRYIAKFLKGTRDATIEPSDAFSTKPVELILKYYGGFANNDIYGALVTVAAFNLLE